MPWTAVANCGRLLSFGTFKLNQIPDKPDFPNPEQLRAPISARFGDLDLFRGV
jgi:hypothetical protein